MCKNMEFGLRCGACALWTFIVQQYISERIWQKCMLDTVVKIQGFTLSCTTMSLFLSICLNLTVYFFIHNIALIQLCSMALILWFLHDIFIVSFENLVKINKPHASVKHFIKCPCISVCHNTTLLVERNLWLSISHACACAVLFWQCLLQWSWPCSECTLSESVSFHGLQ